MDDRQGNPWSPHELMAGDRAARLLYEAEQERLARIARQGHGNRPAGRSIFARCRSAAILAMVLVARRRTDRIENESKA